MKASRNFSAVILTGPRRSGKTTLLKHLSPRASCYLLEDPDIIARVRSDPHAFINSIKLPVILDEIQNVPEILNYVRTIIDRNPERKGQWFLTGSQEAPLMRGVTESMAGRAAIFQLMPFSVTESSKVSLFRGGFPEVLARPVVSDIWFRSYVQTYLERDVRAISSIRDLATFRRFLSLLASRCGQLLNRTDLAAPLGVSVPTISEWLNILEITSQIVLVQPFYENFGKRLIKSPKLYFVDTGLACHLLGIESAKMLERSSFLGAIFEGMVASEIAKQQVNAGKARELYYFRDQQGLEVDFVVPAGNRRLLLVEAKASQTVMPQMAGSLQRLASSVLKYDAGSYLIYRPGKGALRTPALSPGTEAVALESFLHILAR
ncbi:MAG: ATP-binding protein [Nitrospirae bacterium]|nr:ATP-binding protein [Nitrospirota bacterium]